MDLVEHTLLVVVVLGVVIYALAPHGVVSAHARSNVAPPAIDSYWSEGVQLVIATHCRFVDVVGATFWYSELELQASRLAHIVLLMFVAAAV